MILLKNDRLVITTDVYNTRRQTSYTNLTFWMRVQRPPAIAWTLTHVHGAIQFPDPAAHRCEAETSYAPRSNRRRATGEAMVQN